MKVLYDKVLINAHNFTSTTDPLIYLNHVLLSKWHLTEGQSITLRTSSKQVIVTIYPNMADIPTLLLPMDIYQNFSLPFMDFPVQIGYGLENNEILIGPFLTLLTNHTPNSLDGTFGEMEMFFREMNTACQEKGYLFYIIPLQRLSDEGEAKGFWPHDKSWELMMLPIPNVIYNRIPSRRLENSRRFHHFTDDLLLLSIPIFNSGFLSKREVHDILLEDDTLIPFLPETIPFDSEETFVLFLQRNPTAYVKPSFGSMGRNICKLTKVSEGWVLEHSADIQDTRLIHTEELLYKLLKQTIRKKSFIVQKGISLLEIDDKKIDFRVLLNKDKLANWKITSMISRHGFAGHIVSNLSRGGEMKNAMDFLTSVFDRQEAIRIYKDLGNLALKTAITISRSQNDQFGELGIDLALDSDNQPWIIEVNSKPSKKFQGNYEKTRPSVKSIIEYMNFLYENLL